MEVNETYSGAAVNATTILRHLKNITLYNKDLLGQHADSNNEDYELLESGPLSSLYIAWLCVSGILFIPGVLGNGMILYLLYKIQTLRVPTNYLIASLAVADLLMMAVMASFVLSDVFQVELPENVQIYLWPSFDIFIGSASIMNLAAVSFDRALAVLFPLRYHAKMKLKQTFCVIRSIWGYSLVMFILSILRCDIDNQEYKDGVLYSAYVCSFILPCFVILVSYSFILVSTVRNVKITRTLEKALHNANWAMNRNRRSDAENHPESRRTRRIRLQEIRIASNMMIILLPFTAGWGFYFGTNFYESIVGHYQRSDIYEWFLTVIPWFNSSVNPIIYLLFTTSLRQGCAKLLCRNRYLSHARETLLSNLNSKQATGRRASQASDEKSSNFGPRSRTSFESCFSTNDKANANRLELLHLTKLS